MQRFLPVVLILLAPALLAMPPAARAQPIPGLYVGGGLGANFLENERFRSVTVGGRSLGGAGSIGFDAGWAEVVSVGWGFGNGVRVELEQSYRSNNALSGQLPAGAPSNGYETKYGTMANVLFDLDVGSPYVFPYVGAGVGGQWASYRLRPDRFSGAWYTTGNHDSVDISLAFQAMAGVAFPIQGVPGLSVTAEYRYLGLDGKRKESGTVWISGRGPLPYSVTTSDDDNHSLLLGVRYAFNVPPPPAPLPPAVPVPAPVAAPAPAPARSYLVFFDWDSAALTDRARQIIADAAQNATRVQVTRIEIAGHADRSGTQAINLALSRRRAEAVATELVKLGVARQAIDIQAFGAARPAVPTEAGVREPQNRRVEIVLH